MSKRKEKLLNKYLNKKRKQRRRDDLLAQIARIENDRIQKSKDTTTFVEKNKSKYSDKLGDDNLKDIVIEDISSIDNIQQESSKSEIKTDLYFNDVDTKTDLYFNDDNSLGIVEKDKVIDKKEVDDKQKEKVIDEKEVIDEQEDEVIDEKEVIDEQEDENVSLEDFLGESSVFDTITCLYRPVEIEEFRKTLPIYYEKEEIISTIKKHSVTLIKGDTGCGKTTQIPQFLYEGGFKKMIGVTQPRRISAISISNRINEELGEKKCAYKIRYESTVDSNTSIKIMTDGILLKEIQSDFLLSKYSVILLDEIHERSSNMDILISLLSRIIKIRKERNNELKLVLMSATIMIDELKGFFENIALYEVPCNSFKVTVFYEDKDPSDVVQAAFDRISKIIKTKKDILSNSVLCFLPDKSYIYQVMDKLIARFDDCIILPLHSSLSKQEQSLIYKHYDKRKVILSTNIAETSITIPDVYYVVDSGLVKCKYVGSMNTIEYSIKYISKSSATQRAGRAGRTCPGICYRLYSGNTFLKLDDYDHPKIFYESLDEIILNLLSLGINDIHKFPFLNRPSDLNIKNSLNELKRIRIIDNDTKLTKLGEFISKLPLPPRIAKLLCIPNTTHILPELIDLASLMSINIELSCNAATKKYFIAEKSDLIVILKVFRDFEQAKNKKEFCKKIEINLSTFCEAAKMSKFLNNKFNLRTSERNLLTDDVKNEIRKIIYLAYSDRIALFDESSYWYKRNPIYVSNSSIDAEGEFVVFEYLLKGTKKTYMKNITIIDNQWFNL